MGWLNNFLNLFFGRCCQKDELLWYYLRCDKCGTCIRVGIHPNTDLERGYSENEPAYTLHKEAMDSKCFNMIHIRATFNESLKALSEEIDGATRISEEEYKNAAS